MCTIWKKSRLRGDSYSVPCTAAHHPPPLRLLLMLMLMLLHAYPGWPVGVPLHFSEDQVSGLEVVWHCPVPLFSLDLKKCSTA